MNALLRETDAVVDFPSEPTTAKTLVPVTQWVR